MGLLLHAAADVLTQKDLPVVITFLISRALVCDTIGVTTDICLLLLQSAIVFVSGKFYWSSSDILQYLQADTNQVVRSKMVEAGVAIIDKQGSENVGLLLPIFENYLDKKVWLSFSFSSLCMFHKLAVTMYNLFSRFSCFTDAHFS